MTQPSASRDYQRRHIIDALDLDKYFSAAEIGRVVKLNSHHFGYWMRMAKAKVAGPSCPSCTVQLSAIKECGFECWMVDCPLRKEAVSEEKLDKLAAQLCRATAGYGKRDRFEEARLVS